MVISAALYDFELFHNRGRLYSKDLKLCIYFPFDPVSYFLKMLYKSFGLKKLRMKNVGSLDGFSCLNTCGVFHLLTRFCVV